MKSLFIFMKQVRFCYALFEYFTKYTTYFTKSKILLTFLVSLNYEIRVNFPE